MGDSIAEKVPLLSDGELQMSEIYGREYGGKVPSIQGIESSPEFQLHRGLKACHISMIAIGSAIGTGLIIGSGKTLAQGGPGSVF
ncbi:Dicarboxylic amino acid permease [Ilyonectria robusta]